MFPLTHMSAIAELRSEDRVARERSVELVARAYWRPIFKYVRVRWGGTAESAEDLTQSFFARALDRDMLASYDPTRGRFRTFLRACLTRHVIDEHRRESAERRGGRPLHLDVASAEAELAHAGPQTDPDAVFEVEWLRQLMQLALERLDAYFVDQGKPVHAALFREFHVAEQPPAYADAAARHGITVTTVTNWLHVARRAFRTFALQVVRELTLDADDYANEAKAVFGIDVRSDR